MALVDPGPAWKRHETPGAVLYPVVMRLLAPERRNRDGWRPERGAPKTSKRDLGMLGGAPSWAAAVDEHDRII